MIAHCTLILEKINLFIHSFVAVPIIKMSCWLVNPINVTRMARNAMHTNIEIFENLDPNDISKSSFS